MSSNHCRLCFSPMYQVLSNRVQAMVCLNLDDWPNFMLMASEADTIAVAYPQQVSAGTEHLTDSTLETDYPLEPLQEEYAPRTTDQSWVAQPWPQTDIQSETPPQEHPFLTSITEPPFLVQEDGYPTNHQPVFTQQPTQQHPVPGLAERSRALRRKPTAQIGHGKPTRARVVLKRRYTTAMSAQRKQDMAPQKKFRPKVNHIPEKPLSELTDSESSGLVEVTKFVNRSVEQRQLEAQVAGKIKRPLNPFMLYLKAYHDLAALKNKETAVGTTTQFVGHSWVIEGDSVKQAFFALAATDKSLHRQAFPSYKFRARREP
jgi:hypothetical protein